MNISENRRLAILDSLNTLPNKNADAPARMSERTVIKLSALKGSRNKKKIPKGWSVPVEMSAKKGIPRRYMGSRAEFLLDLVLLRHRLSSAGVRKDYRQKKGPLPERLLDKRPPLRLQQ